MSAMMTFATPMHFTTPIEIWSTTRAHNTRAHTANYSTITCFESNRVNVINENVLAHLTWAISHYAAITLPMKWKDGWMDGPTNYQ